MKSSTHLAHTRPIYRFLFALFVGGLVYTLSSHYLEFFTRLTFGYLSFALLYLTWAWLIIINYSADQVRKKASIEDGSKIYVTIMLIVCVLASLASIIGLNVKGQDEWDNTVISLLTMGVSWILLHTVFTFHYARLYYNSTERPIHFLPDEKPDYWDFAYFSFNIGTAFQVSDLSLGTKKMRKIVLFHSLISFAVNSFIVALTINLLAGILGTIQN